MATRKLSFYRATILNPLNDKECEFWRDGVLVTLSDKVGKQTVYDVLDYPTACERYVEDFGHSNLYEFPGKVIVPSFFDMHFHWVQDDVRTMPKDSLLEWLEKYTFPTETRFASKSYAQKKAKAFFKKLLSTGTLGGACYSSIHEHALESAMKEVTGDVLIGNVLMTMNSPQQLTQTPKQATGLALKLMKKFKHRYVLTPRFAISTDPVTMKETSRFANKNKIYKQSHLSETKAEIDFVMSLYKGRTGFKGVKNYTEIYHKVGMLGPRSLMGHAIHLSAKELVLLKKTKTSLVHCPTSNAPHKELGLGSGLFDFKRIEQKKIPWALGSDIGGGPFLSMLDVMQSFVMQNKKAKRKNATYVKALYRATLAGAEILGVQKKTGNLSKGKEANFIVLPVKGTRIKDAESCLSQLLNSEKKRSRFDAYVEKTFYRGSQVFKRS